MTGQLRNAPSDEVTGSTTLRAAIIYEDFRSGLRGRGFAEALAARFGGGCQADVSLWRTDLLGDAHVAAQAAAAATHCDYLLLVLQGTRVPASATRSWLRRYLRGVGESGASVILLSCADSGTRRALEATRHFLRHVCARNEVPFFSLVTNPVPAADAPSAHSEEHEPAPMLCL